MKPATLKQGNQVLTLILQKDPSAEKLQQLFESGMLSDLLDADLSKVDRKKLRQALGLNKFIHDKTSEGWILREHDEFDGRSFGIELIDFLKPGESFVFGEVMKQRAKELSANLGQGEAEYLFENQHKIPAEYRNKYYLVFPATVWSDSLGNRHVPCLQWDGVSKFLLVFSSLAADWSRLMNARIVRSIGPLVY